MRDYLTIGSAPYDEPCIQTSDKDSSYAEKQRKECAIFIRFLRHYIGQEPEGARLATKRFEHDYGGYYEVVCHYDDEMPESVEYAFKCESECPDKWDRVSTDELEAVGLLDDPLRK